MAGVEGLGVACLVVDHTHSCHVVHNVSLPGVEQVLPTIVATVTEGMKKQPHQ